MPNVEIRCPWCSKSIAGAFAAGSRVQCPRCRAAFALRPEDLRAAVVASPAAPAVVVRPLPTFTPTRRPAAPPPATLPGWVLPTVVVGVSLLLLVGAGVVLALHFLQKPPQQAAAAPVSNPAPPVIVPANPPFVDPDPDPQPQPPKPRPRPPIDLHPAPPPPLDPNPDPDPAPQPTGLSADQEAKVKKAVERGVAYLESTQQEDGSWPNGNVVGGTALPGLTLLDSGVPANDSHVRNAAQFVRDNTASLNETYELALAILFLDRLNDPSDVPLIRTLALRLIAGQSPAGGWTYQCPVLPPKDERNLLTVLRKTRPSSALELTAVRSGDSPAPAPPADADGARALRALPPDLQGLPALQAVPSDEAFPETDSTDNSCTQFAILGLWTARRHDVPMERALAWVNKRFHVTQADNGGWDYSYARPPTGAHTPSMTAAGLLGLAVGHGVTADLQGDDPAKAGGDPAVENGMKALSDFIGVALGDQKRETVLPQEDLYFLWSVERVGVLYNRRTLADKEWYPWGAEILLDNQQEDGSWTNGAYPGAAPPLDTSFALLFLKRANLASDLSTKLQFLTQIKK